MKTKFDVIADTVRPGMIMPSRAQELAHAIVGALISAGYAIIKRGDDSALVPAPRRPNGRPLLGTSTTGRPAQKPTFTNVIAGQTIRRGVFETA